MEVSDFAAAAGDALGDRLIALYRFGSNFARGPRAKRARLLLVVSRLDAPLLQDVRALAAGAHEAAFQLRIDTQEDLFASADVFPVFTLELLDTKTLVQGRDVLEDLAVHPRDLRHHVEQGLRCLHRDLLTAYVDSEDDRHLAIALRRSVRKGIYLLRALGMVCNVPLPKLPAVESLIDQVLGRLLPEADCAVWHRMRQMANYEEVVSGVHLVGLYGDALAAFSQLVNAVDQLQPPPV